MIRQFKDLFHRPNSLKGATGILVVTLFFSNVLGLLRNVVLAGKFKPDELDIYFSGFQIPNLIFNLLVFGAISTAFIPVFSELITNKKIKESWQIAQTIFNLVTIVLVVLSTLLIIIAPQIVYYIVPGFEKYRLEQTITVTRIMFLQAIIFGWSYVIGGILNSYKRFTAYALAPLVYNLAIIVGALLGDKIGIIGLSWSVVVGAFLHLLIQIIPAWKIGFRPGLTIILNNHSIKQILKLMLPRNFSLGVQQINMLVFTALASVMAGGSIAVFNLTNDFQTAPTVIFANSLAVALFPTLSELASKKNWPEFERVFAKSLRMTIFLLVPSAFIMLILRAQIMRLYVGLGKSFDWEATIMAFNTLAYFAIGIVPIGIVTIYSRVFYALKNTKLPMYFGAISIIISIFLANFFKQMGVGGLALALSIGNILNAVLLYLSYKFYYRHGLDEVKIFKTIVMSLWTSVIMAGGIWSTLWLVDAFYNLDQIPTSTQEVIGLFIQTAIALAVGLIIYWLLARLWQKDDLSLLQNYRKKIMASQN